ncbi:MAG TPA: hypothetical protein VM573_03250, partial [Actinomycetota bacterium]|nr:hypothetical protein [Actinomycetota bacterium]
SGTFAFAEPARDLDRDGARDVYAVAMDYEVTIDFGPVPILLMDISYTGETIVTALSGRREKVLWEKKYPDLVVPVDARVGRKGRNGTLMLYGLNTTTGPIDQWEIKVEALEGRRGKKLWERSYRTTIVDAYPAIVATDAPVGIDVFDGMKGRADDILIGLTDIVFAGVAYTSVTRAVVIDGRTGTENEHPARDVAVNWIADPWAVRDLDDDGRDDYVVANVDSVASGDEGAPEVTDILTARRGTDGRDIWTRGGYDFEQIAWIFPLRDVNANGDPDIAVNTMRGSNYAMHTYLTDGGDGIARWDGPGGWPYSPGDIDRNGFRDIVTRDVHVRFGQNMIAMKLWARGGSGRKLWARTFRTRYTPAPVCTSICFTFIMSGFGEIGDLDRDRVEDSFVRHQIEHDPGGRETFFYTVDNRQGHSSNHGGEERWPLFASVDGRGADLADVTLTASGSEVTARRGHGAPSQLWRTTLDFDMPIVKQKSSVWARGVRLDRDRCAEVLLTVATPKRIVLVVLDGSDGSVSWHRTLLGPRTAVRSSTGSTPLPC